MTSPRAWALNLDVELELEKPGTSTPSPATRARIAELAPRLAALLGPDAVLVDDTTPPGLARDLVGAAWCPTPRALRWLARAGASLPDAPAVDVLRRANHRRFCQNLGSSLPGARFVNRREVLNNVVALPPPHAASPARWLLKRPLGFTGRGRLLVAPGPLSDADARWVDGALRTGDGLQVEPWVERLGDFALHGLLGRDGTVTLGRPTTQRCSALGVWQDSVLAAPGELLDDEHAQLRDEALRTARALHAIGYFGPFNLDAFAFRADDGRRLFQPRCEINARYSMGWAVGMERAGGS